ncbi:MAG: sulfatase/phosphatase domain-containing protein [Burkholderiaceae bacterium]
MKKTRHKSHTAGDTKPVGEVEAEAEIRQFIAEYYGMIHNIGVVLNRLDALGIADDSMIIFLSHHGEMLGQHGDFCGIKAQAYRGQCRCRLWLAIRLNRYPANFRGGVTVDHLVDVATDTMPNLLEMCGIDIPAEVDGISYLPLLNGSGKPTRDAVMYQLFKKNDGNVTEFTPYAERGIRTREWLYVRHKNKRVLLFDLKIDNHEMNNLVDEVQYSALMDELDARIRTHMDQTGDNRDMTADFLLPYPRFEDAFEALNVRDADLAMLPIENTLAGRVADIHQLLPKTNHVATNQVNMTKLDSYQVDGRFTATSFYADVEGHPKQEHVACAAR